VPFRYGFILNAAKTAESLVEVAIAAEEHGWDGLFIADAIGIETKDVPAFAFFDPWVLMGAMAAQTQRLYLGTMLTAVPRRRPWKLVREVVTVDHLSNGRAILGTGVGAAEDDGGFYKVGEAMDLPTRAARLDEGLQVIAGLMTGKPFSFEGEHFKVDAMTLLPPPVQKPRVPLWVVGVWPKPKSMARAPEYERLWNAAQQAPREAE
jgi:alkanesulfonate monooxygenase SsuD/methylene tetrahydromethanopterin reductase-like flavin-dependent oxidoreductase (luciferase family)